MSTLLHSKRSEKPESKKVCVALSISKETIKREKRSPVGLYIICRLARKKKNFPIALFDGKLFFSCKVGQCFYTNPNYQWFSDVIGLFSRSFMFLMFE